DRVVRWNPQGFWPAHSSIMVSAGGAKSSFEAGASVVGVADIDAHTSTVIMDSRTIGIPLSDPEGYKLTVNDAVRVTWGGVYVHGAPWSVGSQGYANVSHGCINLSPDNAAWYYDTVSIGDPIIIQA